MISSLQHWLLSNIGGPSTYTVLFVFGAISTTLVPLSPEVAAIAVWKAGMPILPTIAVLTLGNYAGNVLNYYLGYVGEYWVLEKYFLIKKERMQRAKKWFEKYGPPILLLSWLPVVGDPISFIPGIVRYNFFKFSVYILIGKIIRYIGLYYLFSWFI
jgi:membrane protein YqaA with SNARE-associated domain